MGNETKKAHSEASASAPTTETDDSLLNNLEDLVSDDYSDILASTPEEHDDSQYEDKWALELINQEPATTEAKDDLTAPDLDTIEAFEQGEEFSFTDILSGVSM